MHGVNLLQRNIVHVYDESLEEKKEVVDTNATSIDEMTGSDTIDIIDRGSYTFQNTSLKYKRQNAGVGIEFWTNWNILTECQGQSSNSGFFHLFLLKITK